MFLCDRMKKKLLFFVFAAVLISAILVFLVSYNDTLEVSQQSQSVRLPIIMYHSVLKNTNDKSNYTITPEEFEADLKYMKENGYTAISLSELYSFVNASGSLPKKPVMLTFDDGFYNNYYYAYPLLKKYNMKAVISPVMSESEKYTNADSPEVDYGSCTYDNIKEMYNSQLIEIENHSYNLHSLKRRKGTLRISGESLADFEKAVSSDITKAQDMIHEITGEYPTAFVYPYGFYSEETEKLIESLGFTASFVCTERTNTITRDKKSLYKLGRYLRKPTTTPEKLFERMGE